MWFIVDHYTDTILFHEKTDKTRKYSKSAILVCYENGRRRLLRARSINTESLYVTANTRLALVHMVQKEVINIHVLFGDLCIN